MTTLRFYRTYVHTFDMSSQSTSSNLKAVQILQIMSWSYELRLSVQFNRRIERERKINQNKKKIIQTINKTKMKKTHTKTLELVLIITKYMNWIWIWIWIRIWNRDVIQWRTDRAIYLTVTKFMKTKFNFEL